MEQLVYKSNALIESAYRLSVWEQRLILSCISQIRRDEEGFTDEKLYTITASELSELTDVGLDNVYKKLKEAAERLMDRKIWLKEEPNGGGKKPKVMITRWVQTIVYNDNTGTVQLRFGRDVLPYVSQLKSHFTGYKLKEIAHMDSAHAIRLFEILAQYKSLGQRDLAVDELKELMQLEDKYSKTTELKRRVIDPAVTQINAHSSLNVSYTERKSGRRIVAFIFVFSEKALPKSRETIEHTPTQAQAQAQPNPLPEADIKPGSVTARLAEIRAQKPEKKGKVYTSQEQIRNLGRDGESWYQLAERLRAQGDELRFKMNYSIE